MATFTVTNVSSQLVENSSAVQPTIIAIQSVDESFGFANEVIGSIDANGDGISDVVLGAKNSFQTDEYGGSADPKGSLSIIYGHRDVEKIEFISTIEGPRFVGQFHGHYLGAHFSDAGDFDGDGLSDVFYTEFGSEGARPRSGIIFGDGGLEFLDYVTSDPNIGLVLPRTYNEIYGFGLHSSNIGDINGDGIDDIGVASFDYTADVYIFSSSPENRDVGQNWSSVRDIPGFHISGPLTRFASVSVSSAGDINNDGIDDLIFGASAVLGANDRYKSAELFVVYGSVSPFGSHLGFEDIAGEVGFKIADDSADRWSLDWISSAGDINADGIDDVIVGSDYRGGLAFVIYGSAIGFDDVFDLSALDGSNGFIIVGVDGLSAGEGIGDFNGDGIDDIVLGDGRASSRGQENAGAAYVVFGSSNGFEPLFDLSSLDGESGLRIDGRSAGDGLGWSVDGAGDMNGDGFGDVVIGAPGAGEAYIVFGQSSEGASTLGAPAFAEIDEGTTSISVVPILTPFGDATAIAFAGGADASRFDYDEATGLLAFKAVPDFEAPHDGNLDGRFELEFVVLEGETEVVRRLTIEIADVDEAPAALDPDLGAFSAGAEITEEFGSAALPLSLFASNADGVLSPDNFFLDTATVDGEAVSPAEIGVMVDRATRLLTFDPSGAPVFAALAEGETADVAVSFSFSTFGLVDFGEATFRVVGVNDAPDAVDDVVAARNGVAHGDVNVVANDGDVEGDPLSITGFALGPGFAGSLSLFVDGTFAYAPAAGFSGEERFTYTIADSFGAETTATVVLQVPNAAPVAEDDAVAVTGAVARGDANLLANDADADGDPLTIVGFAYAGPGALEVFEDGTFAYAPAPGFSGEDAFAYTVADGFGGEDVGLVTLDVAPTS